MTEVSPKATNNKIGDFIIKSILAGILVSIGAAAFLSVGSPFGPFVFAFGLVSIILTQSLLFTGRSGFAKPVTGLIWLIPMLLLNGVGCWLAAVLFDFDVSNIIDLRLHTPWIIIFGKSILTGIIMTVSVFYAKQRNWLPLILGIPTFIMAGLPHCVADIFYYSLAGLSVEFILPWIVSVAGNFIGCNFHRILRIDL